MERCSMCSVLCTVLAMAAVVGAMPIKQPDTEADAMEFMEKFGYGPVSYPDHGMFAGLTHSQAASTAFSLYQSNMGLNVTGVFDDATRKEMGKPRCGVRDFTNKHDMTKKRRKRYAIEGSRWSAKTLTYKYINHTPDLGKKATEAEVDRAFQTWADVAGLTFQKRTSGRVDIEVLFAAGEHGDGARSAFDGRGGTLAHAYFPQYGGDAHMDEDETWSSYSYSGINLFQVVVHELGHSLGLGHSNVRSSIMFPSYSGYKPSAALDDDDINGIQALYGPRTQPKTPAPTPAPTQGPTAAPTQRPTAAPTQRPTQAPTAAPTRPPTPSNPDRDAFCNNGRADAIARFAGSEYIFQGEYYVRLNSQGIEPGYPRRISDDFQGITGPVDAVLDWENKGRIYVFKGNQYWRYMADSNGDPALVANYPRIISQGFPGLPNNIDAAFVWSNNGRSYVFKGNQYYRLRRSSGRVDYGYPRTTTVWNLNLSKVDAAFKYQIAGVSGTSEWKTYFFSGTQYYRFDDARIAIDQPSSNPYPRPINTWWLGCSSGSLQQGDTMEADEKEEEDRFIEVTGSYDGNDAGLEEATDGPGDDISGQLSSHQISIVTSLCVVISLVFCHAS